ncbi:hypothetical protein [Rhodopirellula sp. P2]|uniref:hypothetical protein n=1 Tax=Rhodopirellula sp. P2 TaxID=2127060 RepID=UPI00236768BE|nr:hypothetical protein [Rhodopirellula sp. P2]WDQ18707.1 hypothetical protein PSR62_09210 [Rhodopirellula sp. P2]
MICSLGRKSGPMGARVSHLFKMKQVSTLRLASLSYTPRFAPWTDMMTRTGCSLSLLGLSLALLLFGMESQSQGALVIDLHQIEQQASITTVHTGGTLGETPGVLLDGRDSAGPAFMSTLVTEVDEGMDATQYSRATVTQEYSSYSYDKNSHLRFSFAGSTMGEVSNPGSTDDEATVFDTTHMSFTINETAFLTLAASVKTEGALTPVSGHGDDLSGGENIRYSTVQLEKSDGSSPFDIFKLFDDGIYSITALELAPGSYNLVTKSRYKVKGDPGESVEGSTVTSLNFSLSSSPVTAVPEPSGALAFLALGGAFAKWRTKGRKKSGPIGMAG